MSKLSTTERPKVLVLIVTYNGLRYMPNFLRSLRSATRHASIELCAVDNASTDEVVTLVEENTVCPTNIIRNRVNKGFAEANNQGFAYALSKDFDAVLVVNYDTQLAAGMIDSLVARLDKLPRIIQPLIFLGDTDRLNTSGNGIHYLGVSYCQNMGQIPEGVNHQAFQEIPMASGAGMLIDTRILRNLGGFDTSYFMYGEDSEFSWRVRAAGYTIWLEPRAYLRHYFEAKRNQKKYFFLERNRYYFLLTHYDARALFVLALPLFVFEAAVLGKAIREGWGGKKIQADLAVVWALPTILKKRWRSRSDQGSFRVMKDWLSDIIVDPERPGQSYHSWYNRLSQRMWQWLKPLV